MNTHIKLTGAECEFDEGMLNQQRPGTTDAYTVGRIVTKPWGQGGYNNGAMLFDDTSFATEKNLHTDQIRTEYRNRYNQSKPFHKPALVNSHGRKKPLESKRVYDQVDCNPNTNWKARAYAMTKCYATIEKAEHSGAKGFKV